MMKPDLLEYFAKIIEQELGIIYQEHNYFQLEKRLKDLMREFSIEDENTLLDKAKSGLPLHIKDRFLDMSTNNETSFFRDTRVFDGLREHVIPSLNKSVRGPIQVWSAASSSGQEALSLSMLMNELIDNGKEVSLDYRIVATDISEAILEKAKKAEYDRLEVGRGLPSKYLEKYFDSVEEKLWRAKPFIRNKIIFQKQNLLDPFSRLGTFDLILCRNVLIYQTHEQKTKVIQRISDRLNPGGFLLLGAQESLMQISDDYESVYHSGVVFYRKKDERTPLSDSA
jgi:chemotaxis protein methyltransferase CheR